MCSADVVREIDARIKGVGPETAYSKSQPTQAIDGIRRMGIEVIPFGEIKLKGLEAPEMVSLIYPTQVVGRQELNAASMTTSVAPARVQWTVNQIKELAVLCLRFEALASSRVFRPPVEPSRKDGTQELVEDGTAYQHCDVNVLLPPMNEKMTDIEFMMLLDSLITRLENAASALAAKTVAKDLTTILTALRNHGGIDERTLHALSSLIGS